MRQDFAVGKADRTARRTNPAVRIAWVLALWGVIAARDSYRTSSGIVRRGAGSTSPEARQPDQRPGDQVAEDRPDAANPVRGWLGRQRDDLIRDLVIGVVVLIVGFGAAALWDSRLGERQNQVARAIAKNQDQFSSQLATDNEIQENIWFVRQVVIDDAAAKPFRGLDLRRASLNGLDLGCATESEPPTGCADLVGADLSEADLRSADLFAASLGQANLSSAKASFARLTRASLGYANLRGAGLRGASLAYANLRGTNLTGADLTGANLKGVCYSSRTTWPDGFTPPPPDCSRWGG
jgi:hypothetical protein